MANEAQTIVGSEAMEEILRKTKAELPTLASEVNVRKIVTDYGEE